MTQVFKISSVQKLNMTNNFNTTMFHAQRQCVFGKKQDFSELLENPQDTTEHKSWYTENWVLKNNII